MTGGKVECVSGVLPAGWTAAMQSAGRVVLRMFFPACRRPGSIDHGVARLFGP